MGILGKLFGKRRNNIINEEIIKAYTRSPGVAVLTNIYFEAADAYAIDNNLKLLDDGSRIYCYFDMMINGQKVHVELSRSSAYGTTIINATKARVY